MTRFWTSLSHLSCFFYFSNFINFVESSNPPRKRTVIQETVPFERKAFHFHPKEKEKNSDSQELKFSVKVRFLGFDFVVPLYMNDHTMMRSLLVSNKKWVCERIENSKRNQIFKASNQIPNGYSIFFGGMSKWK